MNNIGFINVYPYRPHSHQAYFIKEVILKEFPKSKTYSLNCSGHAKTCYLRELKGTGKSECLKCHFGGLNSFSFDVNESVSEYIKNDVSIKNGVSNFDYNSLVKSSSYTLARIESFEDCESEDALYYQRLLHDGAKDFFIAVTNWIKKNNIELLVLFNGRMDYTRAALESAKSFGIPCITHERPLFGHGLILNLNDNCSSLRNIHRINLDYRDKPLNEKQALYASSLLAQRFVGKNDLEWKKYNDNPNSVSTWPTESKRKILVCPSSKNELLGHPDWNTPWKNNTDALDLLIDTNKIDASELVVRFHPSWSVCFGKSSARKCIKHYQDWCDKRKVHFIPSESSANTRDLIYLSDIVILNGSNTILEAGALGKPIICLGPSPYTHSKASKDILSYNDLNLLSIDETIKTNPQDVIKYTLRYVYSKARREPLFFDAVRSKSVVECDYFEFQSENEISQILNGELIVNDAAYSIDETEESKIVAIFSDFSLDNMLMLSSYSLKDIFNDRYSIKRRGLYNVVDFIRNFSSKGV